MSFQTVSEGLSTISRPVSRRTSAVSRYMPVGLGRTILATLLVGFLLAPLLGILGASLTTTSFWQFPPKGLTLSWYGHFVGDAQLVQSTMVSIASAAFVALTGTIIALLLALAITRNRAGKQLKDALGVLVLIPLLIPAIALGVAIYTFYIRFGVSINIFTLGAAQLILVLPLITGLLKVGIDGVRPNVERAAANLGASPYSVFWRVTMPLIKPALIAAAIMAFVRAFDDAAVALFVNNPSTVTLPVRMMIQMEHQSGPLIAAAGSVLLLIAVGLAIVLDRTIGLSRAFGIKARDQR